MSVLIIIIVILSVLILVYRIDRLEITSIDSDLDVDISNLDSFLHQSESIHTSLRHGTQKRIQWFDQPQKTEYSVLYVHGLSASANEISPIPESIAKSLQANLYFPRLTGHGSDGHSLAAAHAENWLADLEQSWNIAASIGEKVIILASSTGATLVECFLNRLAKNSALVSLVYLSPNFGVQHPLSAISSWPFSQYWLPALLGQLHEGHYENELQQQIWTYNYPVAVFRQMQRLMDAMYRLRVVPVSIPLLVFLCEKDEVVSSKKTRKFLSRSHVNTSYHLIEPKEGSSNHVITGTAIRPETNQRVIETILAHLNKSLSQ